MKKNMVSIDKAVRIVLAAIMAFLYYNGTITGTLGIVLIVLAVVFVITSFISFCPLYTIFGIKTCKTE